MGMMLRQVFLLQTVKRAFKNIEALKGHRKFKLESAKVAIMMRVKLRLMMKKRGGLDRINLNYVRNALMYEGCRMSAFEHTVLIRRVFRWFIVEKMQKEVMNNACLNFLNKIHSFIEMF